VSRYFILDNDFSLAIYEGSDAADALTKFLVWYGVRALARA
jgi:hypothetical protein